MRIDWERLRTDINYIELKKEKDFTYDMIIGELNRISVSDDFDEKDRLMLCLRKQIEKYYDLSVRCTRRLLDYKY